MIDRVTLDFSFKTNGAFLREKEIRANTKSIARNISRKGINGAFYLVCDGVEILGESEYDLIDHLFSYLVDGLDAMMRGEEFSTFFPDQPLKLTVSTKRNDVLVTVGKKRVAVPRREFLRELYQTCQRFFELMLILFPSGWDEPYLKKLRDLSSRYPDQLDGL